MTVVTGIFTEAERADRAVARLERRGIDARRISVVALDATTPRPPRNIGPDRTGGGGAGTAVAPPAAPAPSSRTATVPTIARIGPGLVPTEAYAIDLDGDDASGDAGASGAFIGLAGRAFPAHEMPRVAEALRDGAVLVGVDCPDGDVRAIAEIVFDDEGAARISRT